jgi:superfamily II DNA or RNA helicase
MAKSPKLRAYQRTAIESARRALTKSGSCILQMPTGAGKTRAATEIVATSRGVIWFVCHRQEIERQVAKAFTAAGIDFGIVSPRGEMQPKKRVQIVSVGTLPKRIKKLPSPKLVIWDECHHVAAKSWAAIRAKLKDARHLGLTATPERLDGKGLGEWFAELVTGPGIAELIKKGFLSEFRYFAPSDPDLTNAKMQAGDYKKADLGKIMNTPVLIGDAVREYKKNAKGKRALAFCASVEASRALAERFNDEGIAAAHVDGTTPTAERDSAVQQLAAGRIKVLCNVEVFTEGFDLPAIDAVILMRPTKSPTLLLQMIGRGLRKAKGKDVAIIMDHAGLHREHAWFADDWHWSLDGGAAKARRLSVERGPRRCPECKEVRAEREPVCACGYEFPTGREIGEFDGVLTEVRGVVPEGYCSTTKFANILGIRRGTVANWKRVGLPVDGEGFINEAGGLAWVRENTKLGKKPARGCVSRREFCRMLGVTASMANKWVRRGMPTDAHGNPMVEDAKRWVTKNSRSEAASILSYDGLITLAEVERLTGLSAPGIKGAAKRGGLRTKKVGLRVLYDKEQVIGWIRDDKFRSSTRRAPQESLHEGDYERRIEFTRRIGISSPTFCRYSKMGLPRASNGWVHIQRGLEWVRDNTNIKIPASAWPKKAARSKTKQRNSEEQRLAA